MRSASGPSTRTPGETALRPYPEPDLSDPDQFNRELARRVYEETANQASSADEPHDVVRIAERLAPRIAREMAEKASASR